VKPSSSKRKGSSRAVSRGRASSRAKTSSRARKSPKKSPSKSKASSAVSRARAATPARTTRAARPVGPKPARARTEPIPSPLPTRHVAPPRPVLVTPARSMPPVRDQRKPLTPAARGTMVIPDFAEAGVILAITYSIREGRRGEFFDLLRELKPLLSGIGGTDCTVYEDRSRPNYFMEVFRFKDEAEFTAFDDKFHKDRKIAAIYALLDDIVEAEKSDFKIFERRL
jgi:hypothetical protein